MRCLGDHADAMHQLSESIEKTREDAVNIGTCVWSFAGLSIQDRTHVDL